MQRKTASRTLPATRDFRRSLRVLERELMRQLEGETSCCSVTLTQCHALLELSFQELSLRGLSAALDLDASTLSRTVDGLVKAGLVRRAEDPSDRRSIRLALTPEGVVKVGTIDARCESYYSGLFETMPEKDQRCIFRAVRVLAHAMRERRSSAAGCGPACAAPLISAVRKARVGPRKAAKEKSK